MASPDTPTPPRTFAERAAARTPLTGEELAEVREEMRREAALVSTLIETYGHPFEGLDAWWTDTDEAPDAA